MYELKVIYPIPPIWISARITSWPKTVQVRDISTVVRPVVERAETAVNRSLSGPQDILCENGSRSRRKPMIEYMRQPRAILRCGISVCLPSERTRTKLNLQRNDLIQRTVLRLAFTSLVVIAAHFSLSFTEMHFNNPMPNIACRRLSLLTLLERLEMSSKYITIPCENQYYNTPRGGQLGKLHLPGDLILNQFSSVPDREVILCISVLQNLEIES